MTKVQQIFDLLVNYECISQVEALMQLIPLVKVSPDDEAFEFMCRIIHVMELQERKLPDWEEYNVRSPRQDNPSAS